jgi:adenylosuccinate lyase
VAREDADRPVQENTMRSWQGEGQLIDLLKANPKVTKLLAAGELEELFDLDYHLKQEAEDEVTSEPKRRFYGSGG